MASTLKKELIAHNNKAEFEYFITDTHEAGIVLKGTEVKALRRNKTSLAEAHAAAQNNELFIYNLHIAEYTEANQFNHSPKQPRKLLLHRREIKKLIGLVQRKGYSLIPLEIYFNSRNLVKITIALGKGKKQYDKREAIKEREWGRDKARVLKMNN